VQLGTILLWEDDVNIFRTRVERAESLGYGLIGIGDSPGGYRDMAVSQAIAALATERATIAATVTSPEGRHPAIVACALATLQELSQGRYVWGIGTGGSATAALGVTSAPLSRVVEHAAAVRDLLEGRSTVWDGVEVPPLRHPLPVPMFLSAYGPRARHVAGERFDGVILATGSSVELLDTYLADVAAGAESAGRDPASITAWVMARGAVADDREEALTSIRANLASAATFGLRSKAQLETVPADFRPQVLDLQRRYDATQHVVWDGPNARLVEELGLSDYLAGRFAVVGTPEECRDQIAGLEAHGVSAAIIPAVDRDPDRLLWRLADAVHGTLDVSR
jgi:alkanesulfonate monooxygenase SsuD/methylene tetrahydromethanopterin reductase-like flavin-dependent oxidoreductase (luciferase family)